MSDFFERIVALTLGGAATVRPLAAPTFAPAAGAGDPVGVSEVFEEVEAGAAPLRASASPAAADPASPGAESSASARSAPSEGAARAWSSSAVSPSSAAPRVVQRMARSSTAAASPAIAAERAGLLVPDARAAGGPGLFDGARSSAEPAARPAHADLSTGSADGDSATAAGSATATATGPRARAATSPMPAGVPAIARALAQAVTAAAQAPGAAAPRTASLSSETAPTIRVSIGRVDVRAILPSPPPARAAKRPAGPALTLDKYLADRDRGDR